MDLSKYEKINGYEALKRLVGGERIYSDCDYSFQLGKDTQYPSVRRFVKGHKTGTDDSYFSQPLTIHVLCGRDWYIPKPFDVRQAMRDKSDEWVGAFKNPDGYWLKVGFSTKRYVVLMASIHYSLTVGFAARETENYTPTSDELDRCISIKDVPKDAY